MSEYSKEKYYWLKLDRNFFKRHDIMIVEKMPNGKDYILFYLKLMVESIDHNGSLRFNETIPYNEEMLATVTNTNIDVIRSAIKIFTELEMIEIVSDGTIYMNEVEKIIGYTSRGAEKKKLQRENNKEKITKIGTGGQMADKCPSDKEIDKEKDKEIDIYNPRTYACEEIEKSLNRTLSPIEITTIEGLIDNYSLDAILEALEKAKLKTSNNQLNYAKAILENAKNVKEKEIQKPVEESEWAKGFRNKYN